jgi:protein tyrosine phosphatase (PTP) superfamily phosphohydrolase (DUF442 family)
MKRLFFAWVFSSCLIVSAGCRTTCERHPWCHRNDPPPVVKPVFVPPPPPTPCVQAQPIQQSGGFPVLPPGALVNPPPTGNVFPQAPPAGNAFPQAPPSISKTPEPKVEPQWQPREGPEPPMQPESRRDVPPRIQLYAPEPIDKDNPGPGIEKNPSAQRPLPPIPQFAEAKTNVLAGLRPPLDGLDWLQTEGVKTVVQIRLFGEDDSADQKQVEKRNMRYIAFEVSPEALTKEKADEFVALIRDGAKQGIFVYDRDGSLAGSMWYLYLRMGETLEDDASRIRARSLGLQTNREGQHREMWLAVRKLLDENSR